MTTGRGVTYEALHEKLQAGEERFSTIDAKLCEIATLLKPLPEMQSDIAATKELVEAWNTGKNVARFVKWTGAVSGAFVAMWLFFKTIAKALGIP